MIFGDYVLLMVFDRISRLPTYLEITIVVLGTIIATLTGLYVGGLVLPILQVIVVAPFFLAHVWKWKLWKAAGIVLLWSFLATLVLAGTFYRVGCSMDYVLKIVKGRDYLAEMIYWIETGIGPEGDPSLFLIPKIIEIILFSVVTLATAGVGGLFMGAILLNYMNTYYGVLVYMAQGRLEAILFGWPLYAIIRVIGYTLLGTYLSRLTMSIIEKRPRKALANNTMKKIITIAITLIILDFILKATIANIIYQPILNKAVPQNLLTQCKQIVK